MRGKLTGIIFIVAGGAMVVLCLQMVFTVLGQQLAEETEKDRIQKLLDGQAQAWTQGDLDFMAGYHRSQDLTFFSGGDSRQGWEDMRQRYHARYQAGSNTMGTLQFTDVQIELTGPQMAFVRGRYQLAAKGKEDSGLFTLILRKTPSGWRVVHDHTSQ